MLSQGDATMTPMTGAIHVVGDNALFVDVGHIAADELHRIASTLRADARVAAAIVGEQSIYAVFSGPPDRSVLEQALRQHGDSRLHDRRRHDIEVDFSPSLGPDLEQFLQEKNLDRDTFLRRIATLRLETRYLGFRAGFAYLEGWPEEWRLPRRPTSRNVVPAGTFAIAGATAGFYPIDSPGGWNLLGRTSARLWDPWCDPPNLIAEGDEIAIVPRKSRTDAPVETLHPSRCEGAVASIDRAGQLTLSVRAKDWGRIALGLSEGGPFDECAASAANLAAGNRAGAGILECVLVGPDVRLLLRRQCAWAGSAATVRVDGRSVPPGVPFSVEGGQTISIGRISGGLRGYLAIEGGTGDDAAPYEVTPKHLRAGSLLWPQEGVEIAAMKRRSGSMSTIEIAAGPHPLPESLAHDLMHREWHVSSSLDRIGVRIVAGGSALLPPSGSDRLPSCGAQAGSIQWHPSGDLMILGPDHPITGGYLQPFTVPGSELWKVGQLTPGQRISLKRKSEG
jgi:KipI family sensor histidine kinase inhibitor